MAQNCNRAASTVEASTALPPLDTTWHWASVAAGLPLHPVRPTWLMHAPVIGALTAGKTACLAPGSLWRRRKSATPSTKPSLGLCKHGCQDVSHPSTTMACSLRYALAAGHNHCSRTVSHLEASAASTEGETPSAKTSAAARTRLALGKHGCQNIVHLSAAAAAAAVPCSFGSALLDFFICPACRGTLAL